MTNGGRRIATATGAMLADPDCLGNVPTDSLEPLFDPQYWRSRGELREVSGGRGSAWFIASGERQWALRHFRRGGFIARVSQDRYVWAGEDRVRAFAEWRLLAQMRQRGLPVPEPVAARYQRSGFFYRCDLITRRINGAEPLSAVLARGALSETAWHSIGVVIAQLHDAGVDHADLNAHNILIGGSGSGSGSEGGSEGTVSVIDFDRGRMRAPLRTPLSTQHHLVDHPPERWAARNLRRLRRSLAKISRLREREWNCLMAGYADAGAGAGPTGTGGADTGRADTGGAGS